MAYKVKESFLIPLIFVFISILTYRYLTSGPFVPLSCQFLKVGCLDLKVHGFTTPEFADVKTAFVKNFENGDEIGSGVTVYHDGKLVVDLYGGYADMENKHEYGDDTLTMVFSTTKLMSSIVVAHLVDQGILDYSERISTYWPEFAQGNKENVTLQDLVGHRAGVSYIDAITESDIKDYDKLARHLAAQPHSFNGESIRAYHAITYGWYLNEIVRRMDPKHRTIGQFINEEMSNEYGIEFHVPLTSNLSKRVAKLYEYPTLRLFAKWVYSRLMSNDGIQTLDLKNTEGLQYKAFIGSNPVQGKIADMVKPELATLDIPGYNGFANAKSVAKLATIMGNGGQTLNVKPFLSKSTVELISTRLPITQDLVISHNITPSIGGFAYFKFPGSEETEFIGWGGLGGSFCLWNQEFNISFGYVPNALHMYGFGDKRSWSLLKEIVNIAKKLQMKNS